MEDVPVYEMRENPDTGEKERVQVGTRQVFPEKENAS